MKLRRMKQSEEAKIRSMIPLAQNRANGRVLRFGQRRLKPIQERVVSAEGIGEIFIKDQEGIREFYRSRYFHEEMFKLTNAAGLRVEFPGSGQNGK